MGLDSREYMRDVPIYRRLVGREPAPAGDGGSGGRKPPTSWADPPREPAWWGSVSSTRPTRARRHARTRPWAWFLLGVAVTLAVVGYVSERGVPLIGGSDVELSPLVVPARLSAPLRLPLGGPEQVQQGATVVVEGVLPPQHGRIVLLRARWNGGPWQGVGAAQTADDGSFRARYTLEGRGVAQLRIVIPRRGFAYKWFRVG